MKVLIACSYCGKRVPIGNTNGLPNAIGFPVDDERMFINLCQECIIKLGMMSDEEKACFFKELGI